MTAYWNYKVSIPEDLSDEFVFWLASHDILEFKASYGPEGKYNS